MRKTKRPDRGASIKRTLRVLGLLCSGEYTTEQLAAAVNRDRRTVQRDLAALDEIGIVVEYRSGADDRTRLYSIKPESLIDQLLSLSA
jgi:predicted DNA-binding transcriptional regulator YafY